MNSQVNTPATGQPVQVTEPVHRSISQLVGQASNVKQFYLGISSNGQQGMQDRMNDKYGPMGYDNIQQVYTSSSDRNRKAVETELVDYYGDHQSLGNQIGGGGGPVGTPEYSVYLATKEYKEPPQHVGPNGGEYHYTSEGNKTYGEQVVHEGPRGGKYVYTESGNKEYL